MRYFLLFAITIFVSYSNVYSQSYNLNINLSTGEVVTIPVDDIQRIVLNDSVTGVDDTTKQQHSVKLFKLMQNYPNPFNPLTTIRYQIPNRANVIIKIYDIKGQLVKEILNEYQAEGIHQVTWNGTDKNNNCVASGIYFYAVVSNNMTLSKKMIFLK